MLRTAFRGSHLTTWKTSRLSPTFKFLGKAALVTHIGFALSDGVDAYNACREN
jgi:hypothetical protein